MNPCMHGYEHACMQMCVCMHVCVCACMRVCVCACMHAYTCVHVCIQVFMCEEGPTSVCASMCVIRGVCVCGGGGGALTFFRGKGYLIIWS